MPLFTLNGWQAVLLALAGAMIVTWYALPGIVKIASIRHLTDMPGRNKIHFREIPTLGGTGIFCGFTFGFLLSVTGLMDGVCYFTTALIILFFTGMKDDLITIRPYKKIVAQVLAAIIITSLAGVRFTSLHGFLGITVIPVWLSYLITIFLIVIIINAYNLIDGIDGLAGSVGIIASATFGIWSYLSGDYGYAAMAAALTGSLIVFLVFNMSKGRNKIFMGDTGSMVVGFIITVMSIRFNEINAAASSSHVLHSAPAVSMAVLIIPLFDTLRVITIRLVRGQSPLRGDQRHVHHMLLRAGCSHRRATLYISLTNIFMIAVGFLLDHIGILRLSIVLLVLCIVFMVPVYLVVAGKENWGWKKRYVKYFEAGEGALAEVRGITTVKARTGREAVTSMDMTGIQPPAIKGLKTREKEVH